MINAGFNYDLPVGSSTTLTLGSSVQYSSAYTTTLGERPDTIQPAFAKINANIALKANDGGWELALIGTNLTNKFTTGNCTIFDAAGGNVLAPSAGGFPASGVGVAETACIPDPGRQVYVKLTLRPLALQNR
jgi:iron complex outermembrane receptor protein